MARNISPCSPPPYGLYHAPHQDSTPCHIRNAIGRLDAFRSRDSASDHPQCVAIGNDLRAMPPLAAVCNTRPDIYSGLFGGLPDDGVFLSRSESLQTVCGGIDIAKTSPTPPAPHLPTSSTFQMLKHDIGPSPSLFYSSGGTLDGTTILSHHNNNNNNNNNNSLHLHQSQLQQQSNGGPFGSPDIVSSSMIAGSGAADIPSSSTVDLPQHHQHRQQQGHHAQSIMVQSPYHVSGPYSSLNGCAAAAAAAVMHPTQQQQHQQHQHQHVAPGPPHQHPQQQSNSNSHHGHQVSPSMFGLGPGLVHPHQLQQAVAAAMASSHQQHHNNGGGGQLAPSSQSHHQHQNHQPNQHHSASHPSHHIQQSSSSSSPPPLHRQHSSSVSANPTSHHHHAHPQQVLAAGGVVGATASHIAAAVVAAGVHPSAAMTVATGVGADPLDCDPRELEAFAEHFKQRRIKLGATQADVGSALGKLKLPGVGSLSQSTICRFESLTLSHNNMVALKPILYAWLIEAERTARETKLREELMNGSGGLQGSGGVNGGCIGSSAADRKRKRTSIAAPEKRSLEAYFAIQPRPSGEKIAQIADKLDLKKNVVRVWFCNQRQKQKRMKFSAATLRSGPQ